MLGEIKQQVICADVAKSRTVNWRFEETNYLHSSASERGLSLLRQRPAYYL